MTDTTHDPRPVTVADNIRAELARAGATAMQAQNRLNLGEAAWRNRMASPGTWRIGELEELARWLHVDLTELVRRAR